MLTTQQALDLLKKGHAEFLAGHTAPVSNKALIQDLYQNGQHPFATIITCSDSRVSPEILFNCRLGDIFVIRTAGNVLSDIDMGSVEYAVGHLHTPLVLVMGHTHCGAVQSACAHDSHHHCSPCLQQLLNKIIPSVEIAKTQKNDERDIADMAEDLNIENTMQEIIYNPSLKGCESIVYGAKYDIKTAQLLYINHTKIDTNGGLSFHCLETLL